MARETQINMVIDSPSLERPAQILDGYIGSLQANMVNM